MFEWNYLLAGNGTYCLCAKFSDNCFYHTCVFARPLKALDENRWVYETDTAHLCTTPEHHIFTLPSLPSIADEVGRGLTKLFMTFSMLIVVFSS